MVARHDVVLAASLVQPQLQAGPLRSEILGLRFQRRADRAPSQSGWRRSACATPCRPAPTSCRSSPHASATHRRGWVQRRLGASEQSDKWDPCLIAALMPRSRREIRNGSILGLPKTDEATKPVGTEVTSQQPHARDRPAVRERWQKHREACAMRQRRWGWFREWLAKIDAAT